HEARPEERAPHGAVRGLEVSRVLLDLGLVLGRRHARWAAFSPFTHLSNSACVTTWAFARIVAWPRPQSSEQMTAKSPVRVGVTRMVVSMPGTASCFWPNSGTQKEWITSSDCIVNFVSRSTGRTSSPDFRPPLSGYSNFHANC